MYKMAPHLLAASAIFAMSAQTAFAETVTYAPLTTIPGIFQAGVATNPVSVVKGLYGLAIGAGSIIAVVMIVLAGFKYMYDESIYGKSGAREQIQNAFLGLIVILGSYILLRTINAELVNFNPQLPGGSGKVSGLVASMRKYEADVKKAVADGVTRTKAISDLNLSLASKNADIASLEAQIRDIQEIPEPTAEDDARMSALKAQLAQAQIDRDATQRTLNLKTVEDLSVKSGTNALLVIDNAFENEMLKIAELPPGQGHFKSGASSLETMSAKIKNQISTVSENIEKMEDVPIYGDGTNPDVQKLDAEVAKAKQNVEYLKTTDALMTVYKNQLNILNEEGQDYTNLSSAKLLEANSAFAKAYDATLQKEKELRQVGRDDLADQLGRNLDRATDVAKTAFKHSCNLLSTRSDVNTSLVCQPASGS